MDTGVAMELAYVLGAICIVYKLAFIIRQTAGFPAPLVLLLRLVALSLGTLVALRAVHVFDNREEVELWDVGAQLAWCCLLVLLIVRVGQRQRAW